MYATYMYHVLHWGAYSASYVYNNVLTTTVQEQVETPGPEVPEGPLDLQLVKAFATRLSAVMNALSLVCKTLMEGRFVYMLHAILYFLSQ